MAFTRRSRWLRPSLVALALFAAACQSPTDAAVRAIAPARPHFAAIPAQGTASTLDVGAWNLEWFGDASNGPTNEALQQANVRDVIAGADADVWGLEEVVSKSAFDSLVARLPGYAGVLANDPSVVNGPQYYSDFSNAEQKVALVYKTGVATVKSAKIILTANDYDFAGRPPMEVQLTTTLNGVTQDLVVIVLHMKAGADQASWQRRQNAAAALKSYLDATYPTQKVIVLGDWNDDVDTSILAGSPTPYANFVADSARYRYPLKALSDAGQTSEASYAGSLIDQHLVTNDLLADYVAGSGEVFRADQYVASYGTTTSDHYPTITRYAVSGGGTTNAAPTASFTSTCLDLACTFTDGSSDPDGTIASRSWNFGDGSTSTATNPSHTYAAAGTYTVTLTVTDNASAAGSTSHVVTVLSSGGGPAKLIINEVLANEPGSNTAGEAIEFVNVGGTAQDISGWTVSDGAQVRHTFAAGTVVQPGKAIAVFGGASAIPSGIVGVAASTGTLNLANSGDKVVLKNGATIVDQMSYTSSLANSDAVSINRSPDGSASGTWVKHNTISSLSSSIGRHASGVVY